MEDTPEKKKTFYFEAIWPRLIYIILFALVYGVAELVVSMVVFIQLLIVLFTKEKNEKLLKFGQSLSNFVYQILAYMTFNSDDLPWPFGSWPDPKSLKEE